MSSPQAALEHIDLPSRPRHFRLDIQGLRALAIIGVVTYHATGLLPGGFLGVDVFFVISGYVITALIERRWHSREFSLTAFAAARFRRLAPALGVVTVVTLLVSPLFTSPFEAQETLALTSLASTFWVANFVIASTTGDYFAAPAITNPLLQMWSLSVEEQLYVIFAVLALLSMALSRGRFTRVPWGISISAVTLGSFLVVVLARPLPTDGVFHLLFGFYGPLGRVWEFGIGALIALFGARVHLPRHLAELLTVGGLILILLSFTWMPEGWAVPGFGSLAPVVGTSLVLLAGFTPNRVRDALGARPFVFVGDRSYSIYLWHWPLIVWAATFSDSATVWVLATLVALIPAQLSYIFIENPIRHRANWTRKQFGVLVITCLGLPSVVALGVLFGSRRMYGIPGLQAIDAVLTQPHLSNFTRCYEPPLFQGPSGNCAFNADLPGRPIFLVGDSNADHLSEAVVAAGQSLGRPTAIAYQNNCPILQPEAVMSDPGSCMSFVSQVFSHLEGQPSGTVVLSISDTYPFAQGSGIGPLVQATKNFIRDLEARGHTVVLVRSVPKWTGDQAFDPRRITLVDFLQGRLARRASTQTLAPQGSALWSAFQAAATDGSARIFDPWPVICPEGTCATYRDGRLVYSDAVHITVAQSLDLAPALGEVLARDR